MQGHGRTADGRPWRGFRDAECVAPVPLGVREPHL